MRRDARVDTFWRMQREETRVSGFHGFPIAGTVGRGGPDATLEWTPAPDRADLLEALAARLGSEVDPEKIAVAAASALKQWASGAALDGLLAALPWPLRQVVASSEVHLPPIGRLDGLRDLVAAFARAAQRIPAEAEGELRAFFGAVKETLPARAAEALGARLPDDVAAFWRAA